MTMKSAPPLDSNEQAKLLNSLRKAEEEIKAGEAVDYDPKKFKDRLIGIYQDVGR
jgi:hypothetical protein